jgi:adenosylcobinamide-GDP ribazoletransferase
VFHCFFFFLGFLFALLFRAFLGILSGLVFFFTLPYLGHIIAASIALSSILIITGFNHMDGVLDTGDALMFRGSPERRLEILKDHYLGAGGFGSAFVIYLLTFSSLTAYSQIIGFSAILSAEILVKSSYPILVRNAPGLFQAGLFTKFKTMSADAGGIPYVINFGILILVSLFFNRMIIIAAFFSLIVLLIVKNRLIKIFGGLNGDILGFIGEFIRPVFLLILLTLMLFV